MSMSLLSTISIISKIKNQRLKIYRKICGKYSFFSEISYFTSRQFFAYLLCHVTYITSFNDCSDPGVKLADL